MRFRSFQPSGKAATAGCLPWYRTPPGQQVERFVAAGGIVYDIVTTPLDTDLLKAARARGLRTIDGLSMLIGQAAYAFEKFFGTPAPRQHDADLRKLLTA